MVYMPLTQCGCTNSLVQTDKIQIKLRIQAQSLHMDQGFCWSPGIDCAYSDVRFVKFSLCEFIYILHGKCNLTKQAIEN